MSYLNRRDFLRTGGAAALGLGLTVPLAGCTSSPAPPPGTTTAGTTGGTSNGSTGATKPPSGTTPPGAIADLRTRLKGTVLVPGDAGYPDAGLPSNGRYLSTRPSVIAQCADEDDVVTCVKWANENGVPPVGRGGGHSYAGYSTTPGLLIDIAKLNSVTVDKANGRLVTGGAATNRNIFAVANGGPFLLPGGTCLTVGVGGLVLGGGIGYNTRWAGLTSDHLRASRIVLASGEIVDIDRTTNADLFWACRGGAGGSFGINTSLTFDLVEIPKGTTYFYYQWRGADAAIAVLHSFNVLMAKAPPVLNGVARAGAAPVGGGGPREAIDVWIEGQYIGPKAELLDLLAPILAAAPAPTTTTVDERSFWDTATVFLEEPPKPHSFSDVSRYAADPVPESATAKQVELLVSCPIRTETSSGSMWSLGWVGGDVMNKVGRTDTAYVHRNMSTLLRPTIVWDTSSPASVGDALVAWADEMVAAIAPHTPNESYQNFPNRGITDWQQQYYAENFERLVDVKTKYDSGNLFRNAQSIPTRAR